MHVQEHPTTATYLGNLAQLELAQGRPKASEPLLRRALDISLRVGEVWWLSGWPGHPLCNTVSLSWV